MKSSLDLRKYVSDIPLTSEALEGTDSLISYLNGRE